MPECSSQWINESQTDTARPLSPHYHQNQKVQTQVLTGRQAPDATLAAWPVTQASAAATYLACLHEAGKGEGGAGAAVEWTEDPAHLATLLRHEMARERELVRALGLWFSIFFTSLLTHTPDPTHNPIRWPPTPRGTTTPACSSRPSRPRTLTG